MVLKIELSKLANQNSNKSLHLNPTVTGNIKTIQQITYLEKKYSITLYIDDSRLERL